MYCDQTRDIIVVSVSNSYSVPSHWGEAIAALATGEAESWPWPNPLPPRSDAPASDAFVGEFSYAGRPIGNTHVRNDDGDVVKIEPFASSRYAMPALADGTILHTMYWQICRLQDPAGNEIQCDTIAGEPLYNSTLVRSE